MGEGMAAIGTRRLIMAAAIAAMVGLAGCSRSQPEEATNEVETNTATNIAAPAVPTPVANLAENVTVNASEALPPEKPVPVDQQTLDDASATGMTSHVSRDQDPDAAPPPQN
jgi:hypothetical protein